jgi:hypothetical protein
MSPSGPPVTADDDLRVAARDACARFFVGDLAPSPAPLAWDQPGRDYLAEIYKHLDAVATSGYLRRILGPNVLKVDTVAAEWLWENLGKMPAPTQAHDPVNALLSLPVVVDDSLPEGTWRLVGPDGTILHEGTVGP